VERPLIPRHRRHQLRPGGAVRRGRRHPPRLGRRRDESTAGPPSQRSEADTHGRIRVCPPSPTPSPSGPANHERISDISPDQRSYRFQHLRVPLPVRQSAGTFTVTTGPDADTATVTLTTTFEPIDPTGATQLADMVHGAFQQSLESLRRFIEDDLPWHNA
jgi:hypothetical protein